MSGHPLAVTCEPCEAQSRGATAHTHIPRKLTSTTPAQRPALARWMIQMPLMGYVLQKNAQDLKSLLAITVGARPTPARTCKPTQCDVPITSDFLLAAVSSDTFDCVEHFKVFHVSLLTFVGSSLK